MSQSKAQTVAGTTIGISAALPSTQDQTGYSNLTFSIIAEVTDIGTFGRDYTLVTFNPLADRNTYKSKGSYNSGNLSVKLAKITKVNTQAGQDTLTSAVTSDNDFAFAITYQDGSFSYFQGKVMSFTTTVSTVNNILMGESKIEITSNILDYANSITPPAPSLFSKAMGSSALGKTAF